jgi:hypothetical protein
LNLLVTTDIDRDLADFVVALAKQDRMNTILLSGDDLRRFNEPARRE